MSMGLRSGLTTLALAAAALGSSLPAHALFEDDEARKAILDLRARLTQTEDARRKDAEQAQEQLAPLRRSLLDLNAQIEALRGEVARLRGQNEQLARDLSETQRRLSDQSQSLETRLRPLEPQKVVVDGKEFQAAPDEKVQYEAAMAAVRRGEFAEAATALSAFQKRYPASGYADSARFWLGNALYGKRDYKEAIATFKAFVAGSPAHPRAAEAQLAQANCQIELKEVKGARRTLEDLLKAYPGTEAAQAAKERLATLK
ncbi:tol-pal system protein YbgF [Roseateles sp. DAIF2]|uniref:tol-pal system protein YbgF n=1 Tax=Roseateles sp. DAIF2 TaxID=2714952 RepID=UPI0018A33472|nr:tol-pal system protein YbgF [Roseateles sp. DAIF2]QPF74804.1 tol-pal system protein YbgF [Roseateles sp. DAIF2]